MPKPKPRHVKSPETQLTSPLDHLDLETVEEISPVKEQTLEIETVQVGISPSDTTDTYEERKKFWETVSRESEITITKKKRMSLFEEPSITEKHLLSKKRTSVHEVGSFPPVPKPRSILQTSVSLSESEGPGRQLSESSIDESSGSVAQTELTRISESDKSLEELSTKPMTEYQAAFQAPKAIETKAKTRSEDIRIESKAELEKVDSLDSEKDFSNQAYENAGYISDSGDVEHYISDSEIEDRVPQIRERQMSIAIPVAQVRKNIYERSASLPTEDLYEVSARSVKLRKQYYEQQIKKEMIVEQLTSEVEEEPSPERKTLASLSIKEEELYAGTKSVPEKLSEERKEDGVSVMMKEIAKSFKETPVSVKEATNLDKQIEEKSERISKPLSVKDLAKGFEKELGTVVAGQKIGQPNKDMKGFILGKQFKPTTSEEQSQDIVNFQEVVYPSYKPDFTVLSHTEGGDNQNNLLSMEDTKTATKTNKFETHKPFDATLRTKRSSTESEQSISSEKSVEFGTLDEAVPTYKEDTLSKPSDSMEVHVDKSEIEDSEKVTDIEQDATDMETKSLDSLNASEDHVPEITVTLSGKQRRISEDSEDDQQKEQDLKELEHETEICQSQQRTEDIVWEVSIESEPTTKFDERTFEITTEEATKVKEFDKDEDLSGSVRDESDLGSEIHQDHSESYSDRIKSESYSELEKIILESLHLQKVDPEEAKKIATALIEDIENEIERRHGFENTVETSASSKLQASDYLKELAKLKGLDEREVELVESVLARRERELAKLARRDTEASSMEITDEDLRYSGTENDDNNILEQQVNQLEHEKSVENMKAVYDSFEKEFKTGCEAQYVKFEKIEDKSIKESSIQKDYEVCEDGKLTARKVDIQSRNLDSVKAERRLSEKRDAIVEEDETVLDAVTEETEAVDKKSEKVVTQAESKRSESTSETLTSATAITDETKRITDKVEHISEVTTKVSEGKLVKTVTTEAEMTKLAGKYEAELQLDEKLEDGFKKSAIEKDQNVEKVSEKETIRDVEKIEESKLTDEGEVKVSQEKEKIHTKIESNIISIDHKHETSTSVTSKVLGEIIETDLEKLIASGNLNVNKINQTKDGDIIIIEHEQVKRTYSDESKSSQEESARSPDEQLSTASSGRRCDSDSAFKPIQKQGAVLRKEGLLKDGDTSSSSGGGKDLKIDRKSGIDLEAYSSSGESHYHSFEVDSGKSRPCSSDVEGLIAAGSSEYESALTSQDTSIPSHLTDYHTAVSSFSSKESMKSLDSESSGNLASVEVSEASETLVPSTFEVDKDILDDTVDEWHEQLIKQKTESIDALDESEFRITDTQSKMKRSHEMTFQPEPKVLLVDSPHEGDEKFGTSLDEGSVLSMSVSSTSSASALRTVVELSRADSERLEGSITISGSFDDVDTLQECRESTQHTPTRQADMSTSTTSSQLLDASISAVTITTSSVDEDGLQSVSTQVTSEIHKTEKENTTVIEDITEPKKKGHRRQESTAFSPSMFTMSSRSETEQKIHSDLAESDKYTSELSYKEVTNDEKKDIDETERDEFYETEADQGFHRDVREGRYLEAESDVDGDISRPQSQISKSGFSDDKPDSELVELTRLTSSDGVTEPIERPVSPEPPEDYEIKDDTPEMSSEAQASVGELEQEYTSAITRTDFSLSDVKKVTEKIVNEVSSEKSSFEEAEAEAAFSMVAHVSPAHKVKQICPILEDEDAEKHELETKEQTQKDIENKRKTQIKDLSPSFIPDIRITQHMAPLVDKGFHYPDMEYEQQQQQHREFEKTEAPQTPSSKSSEDTDQGGEYIVEDSGVSIVGESKSTLIEKKETEITESKNGNKTVAEKAVYESDKETSRSGSPNSDSFEMLEKPDLIDDFVVIEEVAREAQESDTEGKSVQITTKTKTVKKADAEIEEYLTKSAPTPTTTKMTDIKYYPDGSSSDEMGFEFEDSPPQLQKQDTGSSSKKARDYVYEYDRELEANRKWIEQQFQGDQAAMMAAGYGYEMEFERGPLEDIKEEDINDFDPTSSRIGSLGSQKESGGSLGSVKDSFSSTPEYDVLAGRKYFTRSGEHDDVSMSSLQEFENLEKAMSLEQRKYHQGSQDSLSNGSFGKRYYASRSGQGDDISVSSLKEFEGLEKACMDAHKIEIKVKEEEAMLAQIDEGQESIASEETESCETISGTDKKVIPDSDEEDYEKRMFEIDEIIRQAQTNVEKFVELKECEKTESLGRGDSFEEVAKVPELELDTFEERSKVVNNLMATSTDSLDIQRDEPNRRDSTDSLDQKTTTGDVMTASTDSIEFQAQKVKDTIMTDSIEIKVNEEKSNMVTSDSLELAGGINTNLAIYSDSIDEDASKIGVGDHSASSDKDGASLPKDLSETNEIQTRAEYMLGSTDSLDPSSSTATHATYQYESESVYSGSFTSGGSNTMVSSTDTIEQRENVDLAAAVRKVWFDDSSSECGRTFTTEYFDDDSKPYVTEVIEPCDERNFSHTIHRRVEMPPEIRKVTFTGADAEEQMRKFIKDFGEGEDVQESEEVDKDGNVHVKRIIQKRMIISDEKPDVQSQGVIKRTYTDGQHSKTIYTQEFDFPQEDTASAVRDLLTSIAGDTGLL